MRAGRTLVVPSEARDLLFRYALALLFMVVFAAPTDAQVRSEFSELHMGVEVRIVMYARDEAQAREAARAAFDRFAALEDIMSDYRAKSEVRLLSRRPGEWVRVSAPLFTVLARAVEVARASDGAFDPTVGPLVVLWREARRTRRLPGAVELDSARARVGWRNIAFDSTRRRIRLSRPEMRLDLGGIAKGYAAQQAAHILTKHGVASALVEAGGDIAVTEAPPGQVGWRIEVQSTDSAVRARARALTNVVISTSGPSSQFVEIDGVRYSHVVDPRTGVGLTSSAQATIIACDGAAADALSTALTVLSRGAATRLLLRYPGVIASITDARPSGVGAPAQPRTR